MKIKSLSAILLSAFLLVSSLTFAIPVSAAEVGYGNLYFIVSNEDYSAQLSTYNGTDAEVIIPDEVYGYKVTSIAPRVFYGNTTMERVFIPETVDTIGLYAFAFCSGLKSITLSANVTSMDNSVFIGCSSLESAQVDCSIEKLPGGTFQSCPLLSSVALSASIKEIGSTAFMDCPSLESLPTKNITKYGSNCFLGTSVSKVDIAYGTENLPWMCFANCKNISEVTIPSSVTSIDDTAFYNVENQFTINCVDGSYALEYAQNNSIPYSLRVEFMLGDTEGDGKVSINDVTQIQRHLAELENLEGIYLYAADANRDGEIDISDATAIQMYLAAYEVSYPIGKIITQ